MDRNKALTTAAGASLTLLAGAVGITLNSGILGASGDGHVGNLAPASTIQTRPPITIRVDDLPPTTATSTIPATTITPTTAPPPAAAPAVRATTTEPITRSSASASTTQAQTDDREGDGHEYEGADDDD